MQSCLGSCEAVGSYLIPSIYAPNQNIDSELLEQHWVDSVNVFRCCVQGVIDTLAFCSVLIDTFDGLVTKSWKTFDKHNLRMALHQCEVFNEHIEQNHSNIGLSESAALKLYYDDLKVMINECKACLRSTIDLPRLRKRFNILLSVLINIEKSLENRNANEEKTDKTESGTRSKVFTFGHVSTPNDSNRAPIAMKTISDSLEMATELDEFISRNGSATHGSVFYETKRKHWQLQSFVHNSSKIKGDLHSRKYGITPKRASKRM